MEELSRYLARVDLDGFTGLYMDSTALAGIRPLLGWPERPSDALNLSEAACRLGSTYRHGIAIRKWGPSTTEGVQFRAMNDIIRRLNTSGWRQHAVVVDLWQRRLTEKGDG
jgi:hypothetical protein